MLTIECPDGSRIIVNRQTPNREIWVAARSGGFHFAWREGAWRDTRSGDELFASLARIIASQGGAQVAWSRYEAAESARKDGVERAESRLVSSRYDKLSNEILDIFVSTRY